MRKTLLTAALAALTAASASAQDFKWQAFYTQTYESVNAIADVWTAPSNQGGLSLAEEDGNHYVKYNHGNNNSRGLYNLDALTADMYEGIDEYRVEFDLSLTVGSNQTSTFNVGGPDIQTMGSDWATPCGNITKYPNNGLGSGSLFSLIQETAGDNNWRVYSQTPIGGNAYIKDEIHILLTDAWYHVSLTVTPAAEDAEWSANVTAEITDAAGQPVVFTVTEMVGEDEEGEEYETESVTLPYTDEGNGWWFKQFYVLSGRYNSVMMIDNVLVKKKVDASAVTPPSLAMTGLYLNDRIISLDNTTAGEGLTPYYALVDADTYETAKTGEGLTGTPYTEPFKVSEDINYIVAWNVNETNNVSELAKLTVEAGWTAKLNAPSISPSDFSGYKKTYVATCDQSNVQPFAPQSYTIYMSADSLEWVEGSSFTVESGKVYAKVEADGYEAAGCGGVEAPEGAYGSTKWSVEGMVVSNQDCILESTGETHLNFGNAGKGRVHLSVQYWSEDYVSEDGSVTYDAENAWAPLKKNGMHFNGGAGDMFILGSGNANGFTVTGITVYNSNKGYIKIDNLNEGDIIQVFYADGSSNVLTVDDPETFTVPVPKYGAAALSGLAIKGEGTVETREVKAGEWGIVTSSRSVVDLDRAGAVFYEHKYTIYNDDTQAADTLLLTPVKSLEAGKAYIYQATADELEIVTLAAEDPVYEQAEAQIEFENETFIATLDDTYEDEAIYTMNANGKLVKRLTSIVVPEFSGYFVNLDCEFGPIYNDAIDYKLQDEYVNFVADVEKAIADYENAEPEYDESGEPIEKPELDVNPLWAEKYSALLSTYAVVPVLHDGNDESVKVTATPADKAQSVNVVSPSGIVLRRGVNPADALNGLQRGLYIVGDKKIAK